jgi:predicted nucleotide-binding protein
VRGEELYAEPLAASRAAPKRVFVAPRGDQTGSQAVIEFLESIECSPIVGGRSGAPAGAIEALDKHQDVGFAIVMLTGDAGPDVANDDLLELGFLLGKLGRNRVCVVRSEPLAAPGYEESVLRVELDDRGEWQDSLVKALRDAGIT